MKNISTEDQYIRQFISELGTEKPYPGFHKSILKRLKPKRTVSVYKPVISSLAWKIIGGVIAAIVIVVLSFLPSTESTTLLVDQIPKVSIPQLTMSFPKISIPTLNLTAIVIESLVVFSLLAFLAVITTLRRWKLS
jgi:hypothetical protein